MLKKIRRVKFDRDTHFDKIMASFFDDKIELSKKEQEMKERWRTAFALLRSFRSLQQVAKVLMRDFGISQAQAYRDIRNATALFGDIYEVDKRGMKLVIREAYWVVFQQALKNKDLEMQLKALAHYERMFDFDKEEQNTAKIEAHEYHIKLPRDIAKELRKMLSKGVVDFNNYSEDVEDADFEEINDTDDEEEGS